MDELGHLLADSGLSAKIIHRVFVTKAKRDGINEPMFSYGDIYDRFVRVSKAVRSLDAGKLVERLVERKAQSGLEYFIDHDGHNCIVRVFAVLNGAKATWGTRRKQLIFENVLFIDPTFGTNCYGMKLTMFVTIDAEGATRVLAYMLHHEEDYEDIFWGLRCFHSVFKHAPSSVLTDSGGALLKAIAKFTLAEMPWADTDHLLCVYHLDQNFYTHIHPLFAGNKDGWRYVHNLFWHLAKDSDESKQDTCDTDLDNLRSYGVSLMTRTVDFLCHL
jgi:hypothetical protein